MIPRKNKGLRVTKVNKEVWQKIAHKAKAFDFSIYKI